MTPLKGLSLLGSVEYESGRTTSTDGIWESRPFALVNFKATYKLRLIKGVTIEGRVDNVLDRYYEYTPGYPGPGRTYFANMRYEF
jgi:iron complex outermembrane receptor protein